MWAVLGGIFSGVAAVVTAIVGYAALKAKRVADRGAQDIDAVKVSISSLQAALAQGALDLREERASHALTRAELVACRSELTDLRNEVAALRAERRRQ